jgi:ABC-type lipopolysaccharide export system ATPase subunit
MVLKIDEAAKSFAGKEILKDVSLELHTGEIVGLFGRNGSGKSTLLKMIFGTLKADKIKMVLSGKEVRQKNIIPEQRIAYLPQERFLPKHLKIRDIIPLYFQEEAALDRIFYAPAVTKFEKLKPDELSVGQLKYIEILLISNLEHPFLLLDEPFSMIDPLYKDLIKELLLKLKSTKGILITDHYYEDVLQITDRNYIISDGAIKNIASKEELKEYGYLSGR